MQGLFGGAGCKYDMEFLYAVKSIAKSLDLIAKSLAKEDDGLQPRETSNKEGS